MTPAEELRHLNRLIRQFESVFKSTRDPLQRERVTRELRQLRTYKQKLESFHEFDPRELEEPDQQDEPGELEELPYLKRAMAAGGEKDSSASRVRAEDYQDREVYQLALYLAYFEGEFLALLSETRLKLDFKHSLERDSFYHRFENLRRLLDDQREDARRMEDYLGQKHEEEMRMRSFKKSRNLIMESDKFFRNLQRFSGGLAEDIAASGSICLNPRDLLRFDRLGGRRLLEGLSVEKALASLAEFSTEVSRFLNVPQIESQES
jgi:hypothetical protein